MAAKRALVVDDSKSARAFLSRLLEQHHLEVDSAESAEEAIEYLTRHRPDVIFMDHQMPGMDGLQAVHAIKNNPHTATIPILMYTSQEGELYVGQARALGAIGVLPKQIHPADVSKVLYQLKLLEDRRTTHGAHPFIPIVPVDGDSRPATRAVPEDTAANTAQQLLLLQSAFAPSGGDVLVRDQIAELRRFMVASLDEQTERVLEDVRLMLRAELHELTPPEVVPLPPPPPDRRWMGLAMAAGVGALLFAGLWLNESADRRLLQRELRAASVASATPPAAADAATSAAPVTARTAATPRVPPLTVLHVPYGDVPLAGARVDRVRSVLVDLAQAGFRGTVDVRTFPGRFCLAGNGAEGYSLAPDDIVYLQCDVVGNPADESMDFAQRQSLPFANMITERRKASEGAIDVRVSNGNADQSARSYPEIGGDPPRIPTAGEWNSAATANNRVEIRWTRAN